MKQTIGVLFGGRSGEHEVSLNSAATIVENFDRNRYQVIPIAISRTGKWYGPIAKADVATFKAENYQGHEVTILPQPGGRLIDLRSGETIAVLDAIFPIIHGTSGEDGVLQGLLELANIPYIGAGVRGSALGMDKLVMRKLLAYHNIPQVAFTAITRGQLENNQEAAIAKIEGVLPYPIFVKPANAGSSVGVSKANNRQELIAALSYAGQYDSKILVEQGLNVREIEIAILGNEDPKASILGEVIPCNEFYDYSAKYLDEKSIAQIPAVLPEEVAMCITEMAKKVYGILDCQGFARVDFFVAKDDGAIYLNELNTLPGFTQISMYPKLWQATGLATVALLDELVGLAFLAYEDRQKNKVDF